MFGNKLICINYPRWQSWANLHIQDRRERLISSRQYSSDLLNFFSEHPLIDYPAQVCISKMEAMD